MCNLKRTNSESQRVEWWLPVRGHGRSGEIFAQRVQTDSYKISKFGDLMYTMITAANNTVSGI